MFAERLTGLFHLTSCYKKCSISYSCMNIVLTNVVTNGTLLFVSPMGGCTW